MSGQRESPIDPQIGGHIIATTRLHDVTKIVIQPEGATATTDSSQGRYEPINKNADRLPSQISAASTPYNGRFPLPYEPQGYINIFPNEGKKAMLGLAHASASISSVYSSAGEGGVATEAGGYEHVLMAEQEGGPPVGEYFTDQAFAELSEEFKGTDGKFLAMTAYGAVPLPDPMLRSIPEKLVSRPIIQEREIFVLKQEEKTRVIERDYTQFEHSFVEVPRSISIEKFEISKRSQIVEIPHFNYKPVIEDKIVEIPLGIKYVEIPIEVSCRMPPRVVPVPKIHIVERIIETTKPVVQEKIIEVPEIIRKKVPKIVIKDIPYVVPKYVEKIIEVPYQPGQVLPAPKGAPMEAFPPPPPLPGHGPGVSSTLHTSSEGGLAGAASPMLGVHGSETEYDVSSGLEQRLGFFPGGALSPQFPSATAISSGFISGATPSPGFIPGAAPSPGFIPGAAPSPGFIPGAAPSPAFIPGAAPSPRFIPGAAPSPGFISGAGPSPRFIPGAALSPGVAPEPPKAHVRNNTLVVEKSPAKGPQTFYLSQGIRNIELPYEAKIEVSIVEQGQIPGGTAIAQPNVRYMAPGPKAMAYNEPELVSSPANKLSPDEPIYAGAMEPIIAHAPPGMRAVNFHTRGKEPEILTQQGVMKYSKFERYLRKDIDKVLPNLPPHELVPMTSSESPSLSNLAFIHSQHAARISPQLTKALPAEEK